MSVFGWEGWEGWEDQAGERGLDSQPRKKVGKGLGIDGFEPGVIVDDVLNKLRADFVLCAKVLAWPDEDRAAVNAEIRRIVAARDYVLIRMWAAHLAGLASRIVSDSTDILQPAPPRFGCVDCAHYYRPGKVERCGARVDLPVADAFASPFHLLPADDGRSCPLFRLRGGK